MRNPGSMEGCLTGSIAILATLLLTAFIIVGCSAPRAVTQLVRDVRTDTVYLSNMQYDSIYVYHDRLQIDTILHSPSKGETEGVLIKDKSIEYRYKLLRDTVKVVQRDSIPYEVTVTEVKEITRPLTWFDHTCRASFWICLSGLLITLFSLFKGFRNRS